LAPKIEAKKRLFAPVYCSWGLSSRGSFVVRSVSAESTWGLTQPDDTRDVGTREAWSPEVGAAEVALAEVGGTPEVGGDELSGNPLLSVM
jgi:hypothetical protein